MPWTTENHTKGQEQYRMDAVGDHRKVDTVPKKGQDVDGTEPAAEAPEWVRGTNDSLNERYGEKAPASAPEGKY